VGVGRHTIYVECLPRGRCSSILGALQNVWGRQQGGQVLVFTALSMVALLAMVAVVVDVGRLYQAHRQLQSAADAAALAAADSLPDASAAAAAAQAYGAGPGGKNADSRLPDVTTDVQFKCFTGMACNPDNGVVVTERATVSTIFARIVGIDSATISATSTASMAGGKPRPAHVMIVLDRTGSMDWGCTAGGTKLQCAQDGVDAFLSGMDPAIDEVGLVVFSPAGSTSTICSRPPNDNSWFDQTRPSPLWTVVGLSTDYKPSATSPLNRSSGLYRTVHCLQAGGSTAYATAIDQAQAVLVANHDSKAQDAIVFFTDGEANYGEYPRGNSSPYRTEPCHQAIDSAASAKAQGTWIYTIEYDSNAADTYCKGWQYSGRRRRGTNCGPGEGIQFPCDEVPQITARSTLQEMASDPDKFFEEPSPGDLTTIFQNVAESLQGSRLVTNGWTGS
jgi:Flp pilus assembly protein TadG